MLFKDKFQNSKDYDQFVFDNTKIMKVPSKNTCVFCRKNETDFVDVQFQIPLCSEECDRSVWIEYNKEMQNEFLRSHMVRYQTEMKTELAFVEKANDVMKDIIVIVHDQLDYLKVAIESLIEHTNNFHLWIWDNASNKETKEYLHNLMYSINNLDGNRGCTVMSSDVNLGFIEPNNELAALGDGEYIILLNSDTKVFGGWDLAMLGWLQEHKDTRIVGYMGGLLDQDGVGGRTAFGHEIDYISGWCLCLSRETYNEFGLFNSDFDFAYAEDSDLCIRIQEAGYNIYSLHLLLVHHYQNKTINAVRDEGNLDVAKTFASNHKKLRELWADYLNNKRVDVRARKTGSEALDEIIGGFE